jgi:2-oxoglutarate dehydrogenase E1 component
VNSLEEHLGEGAMLRVVRALNPILFRPLSPTGVSKLLLGLTGCNVLGARLLSTASASSSSDAATGAAAAAAATAAQTTHRQPTLAESGLSSAEDFLNGTNANVLEEMYELWLREPSKVHGSWQAFFRNIETGAPLGQATSLLSRPQRERISRAAPSVTAGRDVLEVARDTVRVMSMIRAFRHRGHLVANLDPLNLSQASGHVVAGAHEESALSPARVRYDLDPVSYGFTEADMDRIFYVGGDLPGRPLRTLREIHSMLKNAYCGTIGFEYRHMLSKEEKDWIASRVEVFGPMFRFTPEEKRQIWNFTAEAELFEKFLSYKYATAKRFGLEGGESIIPGIQAMLLRGSELGIENVIIGMPHRGRLNVLAQVVKKPLEQIFHEFNPDESRTRVYLAGGSGDVKYHLGTSSDRILANGKQMHLSLVANPSHLEAVDPVVVGKTRAKQFFTYDVDRRRTMALLLHGDAAFAGQGVVAETLELSDLHDYTIGGTVHVIINNQIGFTTDPKHARSSPYPTDVAKCVGIPIFHVNGDDVEAVVHVFRLAIEYRQRFRKDVVVDVFCYRRYGHNELDEPSFTQPLMYKKIAAHPTILQLYTHRLVNEQIVQPSEVQQMRDQHMRRYEISFRNAPNWKPRDSDWLASHWKGFKSEFQLSPIRQTGVDRDVLMRVGRALCRIPESLHIHPHLKRLLEHRKQMLEGEIGIDWALAEQLAFGALMCEGTHVRLSGQDSERGTFSQRHAALIDQDTEERYVPLDHIEGDPPGQFRVCNSSLSEYAVLGFEVGYSLESPRALVMHEAQFGDFMNGAQVIIDEFIASGEKKWRRQCGITMLLPHSFGGQGPDHSSARLERFLQLADDDPDEIPAELGMDNRMQIQRANLQVVNATTPANYFHVLRRQIHRDFRKPLILLTPKELLRLPECRSPLADFLTGTRFHRLIPETDPEIATGEKTRRLIFCQGKVYYELVAERKKRQIRDVSIVRLEQISPFPYDRVAETLSAYPKAELVWCQEEPKNAGAWFYVQPRIRTTLRGLIDEAHGKHRVVAYAGRKPAAAPATGIYTIHVAEQKELIDQALSDEPLPVAV